MNVQRSKMRHVACSCILMLLCVRHGITHGTEKYIENFLSIYSNELYLPPEDSLQDTDDISEGHRKDEMKMGHNARSVKWPPDDFQHTHEESNENLKSLGGIYDYLITDQNVWHGGGGGYKKETSDGTKKKGDYFRYLDPDASERDEDSRERDEDSSDWDDDSSEKDEDSSERDDDSSEKDDDSSERDDDSSEKDDDSSERDEDSSKKNEDSWERDEDSSKKDGDSWERDEDSSGGGDCEIRYFYDIDFSSTKCRLEKEGCHLEYDGFRTVIPDKKRCLSENNRCVLQKDFRRVMLPFTRLECRKYRKNPRMSNEPIHDVNNETLENNCEFHYMDELAFHELSCEMKEGECYLSDGKRMTIIADEENCRLENDTCAAFQDFKTDLPFVSKTCRDFDPSPKIRKRRQIQTYPLYDCRLHSFQDLEFYTVVNCALRSGKCFLELDDMITVAPDKENCFLYGGRCYVSIPFSFTYIPLVDKACMILDEFTEGYSEVRTGQLEDFYVYPMMRITYGDTSMMPGRAAYDFPDENVIPRDPRVQIEDQPEPDRRSRNHFSEDARKASPKGDIFSNSNYTTCVLLVRKRKDKVEKKCYPGNDKTDVEYDRGKNCRMIQGQCFKVRTDPEFLKSYLATPHNNILTCVMLGEECYTLDGDMLLYKADECFEPLCRALVADPDNPGGYCDAIDCGVSDDFPVFNDQSGGVGETGIPVKVLGSDVAEQLSDGLKRILPKDRATGKPIGMFYSVSFIYNDSLSAVYTSPNGPDQSGGSNGGNGDNGGQNFDKNDFGVRNDPIDVKEVEEDETEKDEEDEIDDYDYEEYDLRSSRKPVKNDPISADIWRDAKFSDCIFHMTMRRNRWDTKCYPGNEDTDEISPQHARNCRLIDGECFKVHSDRRFLSSYFKNPPNRMLKCVIIEDGCYLRDKNLLLYNSDDCYESLCRKLRSDPQVSGNYCYSSKCGHSNPNLLSFGDFKGARRSYPPESSSLGGKLDDAMVSPLLKTLKAVVPRTDFQGDPTSVIYSIGLLYNDSDTSSSTVRKVGDGSSRRSNDTVERGSLPLPEGKDYELEDANSTVQKDSEITRRNNGTIDSDSLISFSGQEANGSEISNLTQNVIDGNSNEQQFVISPDGLGRSAKTDGKYQSIDSKESLPIPSRATFDNLEPDQHARYENYKRDGKSNGVANGEDLGPGKSDYFMHYLPVPLDSKSDREVAFQKKRAKYSINDRKNIPNEGKGKSGPGASEKEYFFNPDFPFTFLGSYPGTDGFNDTLIMHENSYRSHDGGVPTVQEISTRTVHLHDDFGPHDVDKEAILDFVANFPYPGWCYPETDEEKVGICCETHENCLDLIEPSAKKFGLKNRSLFKRLHCSCDFNFFKCLKGNADIISNSLGVAYFNIISPKCFASERRLSCLTRNRWKKCVKYGYDQKSKKGYQWIDTPTY